MLLAFMRHGQFEAELDAVLYREAENVVVRR
jgi:hypothetical protein